MILLNGVFGWFTKLPELYQTILVAATIFTSGLGVGLLFHSYKGLPAQITDHTKRISDIENQTSKISDQQETLILTFETINTSLTNIENQVENIYWRTEVLSCYQGDEEDVRECIRNARENVINPPNRLNDYE